MDYTLGVNINSLSTNFLDKLSLLLLSHRNTSVINEWLKRIERPMQPHEVDQRDWSEIENLEKGGPIAIADYFIINDGSLEQLHQKIDAATHDAHFCKSPEQC